MSDVYGGNETGYRLPVKTWAWPLRRCVKCGILDNPIYSGEADLDGAPMFNHRVVIDAHYLRKPELSVKEKAQGFLLEVIEGNRHVKIRAICRECLEAAEETGRVWDDCKKSQKELEESLKEPSWYAQLCS